MKISIIVIRSGVPGIGNDASLSHITSEPSNAAFRTITGESSDAAVLAAMIDCDVLIGGSDKEHTIPDADLQRRVINELVPEAMKHLGL